MNNAKIIVTLEDIEALSDEIIELCHTLSQPIYIQRDGKDDLVLMPLKYYKDKRLDELWPIPAEIDKTPKEAGQDI